ncbi:MAG: ATP-dependent DNA helicase [Candidatus Omnitrophica bacterium]|nr:ATP-dependent DNA helicase [Candidatus Omnitrophota bacterium]
MPSNNVTDIFNAHYARLNDEQKEAVDSTEGVLLVLAGPGTGKTQLLSVRASKIILDQKADPENILILTFTNAAARAMRDRLVSIIGHEGYNVEVETFHSFANSIVLESEHAIKYVKDKIDISDIERVRAIQYILDNSDGVEALRPFGAPYIHAGEIGSRISELKNEGILPADIMAHISDLKPDGVNLEEKHISRLRALSIIYDKYERLKNEESQVLFDERGRKDYDDMILIALDALRNERELREQFSGQYRYIMVDEYQDTNGAQLELLFSIAGRGKPNVCCVGDDDQSIYRFQGATLSNFRVLADRFPFLRTVTLRKNYRSSSRILEHAARVISKLPGEERVEVKDLVPAVERDDTKVDFIKFSTEEEELAYLTTEIKARAAFMREDMSLSEEERSRPFNNIAVLVRRRRQRQKVIEAFLKAGIPYASDGNPNGKEDIRSEKRPRQMLDVLSLAHVDPKDMEEKSRVLYSILFSDYARADQSDILKVVGYANDLAIQAARKDPDVRKRHNLYQEFLGAFLWEKDVPPTEKDSASLAVSKQLELSSPNKLHKVAWAIRRLLQDAGTRPVHDVLLGYISDMGLYSFILEEFDDKPVWKVRDLRALVAFVNMIKQSTLARPGLRLKELMDELEVRETHGMPLEGELATMNQDGVRVYTAHSSKGLEFNTVFIPFCLEQKSWPVRSKSDVVPLPPDIYKSKERVDEKKKLKLLNFYDELRLFYVATTRAKADLIYTAAPEDKDTISRFLSDVDLDPRSCGPEDESVFNGAFLSGSPEREVKWDVPGILREQINTMKLTPTKLNTYIGCKRKFFYNYVLRLPGKKTQHLVFGNCAHKALEEVYSYFMEKGEFPLFEFFSRAFLRELAFQGPGDELRRICLSEMEGLKVWYERESRSPVRPLYLETELSIFLPDGPVFTGTFDKIEMLPDGNVRVVDYKTGKPDGHVKKIRKCRDLAMYECDDYYRQVIAYKMIFDRNRGSMGGRPVTRALIQFLKPAGVDTKIDGLEKGKYRDIDIEVTDDMVDDLEKVIMGLWEEIKELRFEKLPERDGKDRCLHCDFDGICWPD